MTRQQARERINDLKNEVHSLAMKRFISGGDLLAWEARRISANVTEALGIIAAFRLK